MESYTSFRQTLTPFGAYEKWLTILLQDVLDENQDKMIVALLKKILESGDQAYLFLRRQLVRLMVRKGIPMQGKDWSFSSKERYLLSL